MPAGKTYVKIATSTLTSNGEVTFNNIPQNFTDLMLVVNGRATQASTATGYYMGFNNTYGTSGYSSTQLLGNGSSGSSSRSTNNVFFDGIGRLPAASSGANIFGTGTFHILNYSNSSTFKTMLYNTTVVQSGDNSVYAGVGLWRYTQPITSWYITAPTLLASGTTLTLYGIECAKAPYATGGDKVYTTGTHWVHEFYNSGLFVPQQNLSNVDYLVVAGGGGGGANTGAGGGAGGLRSTITATGGGGSLESRLSLNSSTGYTITVGAGGRGGIDGGQTSRSVGLNGTNSSISGGGLSAITSTAGGGGGCNVLGICTAGNIGGSGGGGGGGNSGSVAGSAGTANQGYAGGLGTGPDSAQSAGGGGGAGAVGGDANSSSGQAGNGGAGVAVAITGSSIFYAGGGGGGGRSGAGRSNTTGGTGGGGAGKAGSGATGDNGTSGFGGGGGGGSTFAGPGGNGGSGVVIVRYPV